MNNENKLENTNDKGLRVYDLNELCELLGVSLQVIRRYIKDGKLTASKIGRKYLITEKSLQDFINGNTKKPISNKEMLEYLKNYDASNETDTITIDLEDYLAKTGRKNINKEQIEKTIKDIMKTYITTTKTDDKEAYTTTYTIIKGISKTEDGAFIVEVNKDAMKLLRSDKDAKITN